MYHDREVDGISSFDQALTELEVCFRIPALLR
jgi:hypothetical protein